VIQLVIPELDVPYFAELARAIVKVASEDGFAVHVRQTLGDKQAEWDAIFGPAGKYAEGTILSPVDSELDWIAERDSTNPVVLIGENELKSRFDHIGIDDEQASFDATRHLLDQGRRRIAFVGADPQGRLAMAHKRESGYRAALRSADIAIDENFIVPVRAYHRGDGQSALQGLVAAGSPLPDAVFCATDLVAFGVLRKAFELGINVPGDLAVVGFDGLEEGRYSVPSLTTVVPDKDAIARAALRTLVQRLVERGGGPTTTIVPHRLEIRESSVSVE
jgi:DNA-binding LacI/PurR family transcriptional regulator